MQSTVSLPIHTTKFRPDQNEIFEWKSSRKFHECYVFCQRIGTQFEHIP